MPGIGSKRSLNCLRLLGLLFCYVQDCSALFPHLFPRLSYASEIFFNWTAISPSSEIAYHKCYGNLECARLELPLDWQNESNPNTIALAIARVPAKVNVSDESFGGTIILNPGGPSGSGVLFLQLLGEQLQRVVDGEKHFEILSFDPRGVYHTTPDAHCFEDPLDRLVFILKFENLPNGVDSGMQSFHEKWSAVKGFGSLCAKEEVRGYSDGSNIRQYVSTASVARDMLAIVDKVHENRNVVIGVAQPDTNSDVDGSPQTVLALNADAEQLPLLQYWGFSYGSYLGNTFASMYPSRIGRMILDGVVDAPDYAVTGWSANLQDTEKTIFSLYRYCFDGKDRCPLYSDTDQGPEDIRDRVNNYLDYLKINPIPVDVDGRPELIKYTDVNQFFFAALYAPNALFPILAEILAELIRSDHSSFIPILLDQVVPPYWCAAPSNSSTPPEEAPYDFSREVQMAILCGDGDSITNSSKSDFQAYISELTSQSPTIATFWSTIRQACIGWPDSIRPKWRFTGPFASNNSYPFSSSPPRDSSNTAAPDAAPILFIGNTADPVTPLRNAHAMAANHGSSVVLTLDSAGHCTLLGSPSRCIRDAIRAYFNSGTLPEVGTVCGSDTVPWDGKFSQMEEEEEKKEQQQKMWENVLRYYGDTWWV